MEIDRLLTHGTVNSIMNRKKIENPIIQIIAIKKLPAVEGQCERFRLMISDGQIYDKFVLSSPNINRMIYAAKITEFVIVKLKAHKFVTGIVPRGRKPFLVILDVRVLIYGHEIGFKIGNPIDSVKVVGDGSKTLNSATERNHSTIMNYEEILKGQRTKGSLNSIQNGGVTELVFQLLDTRMIYDNGEFERYRLLLSDGQNLGSFALLGVKDYLQVILAIGYTPIIIITDLVVLVNGHRVDSKIGDPKVIIDNSYPGVEARWSPLIRDEIFYDFFEICQDSDTLFLVEYEQMLTTGSLESMMSNAINESCMQVLKVEKIINHKKSEIYRLLLSDGHFSSSCVLLESHLNDMVIPGILDQFSLIKITDHRIVNASYTYSCSKQNIKMMIIHNLLVLKSGEHVKLTIGNPKPIGPENETKSYKDAIFKFFHFHTV